MMLLTCNVHVTCLLFTSYYAFCMLPLCRFFSQKSRWSALQTPDQDTEWSWCQKAGKYPTPLLTVGTCIPWISLLHEISNNKLATWNALVSTLVGNIELPLPWIMIINYWFFRRGKSDMFQYFSTILYVQFRNSREWKSTSGGGKSPRSPPSK